MKDLLTDYLPSPDELPTQTILDGRSRLEAYLKQWWPDLDTRPNSPFGDLHLTPLATIMVALERAMEARDNDLNLANIAQGRIASTQFVEQYLQNFGLAARQAIPSTGVIDLVFTENKQYNLDPQTLFTFGRAVFKINPGEGNPVIVYPTSSTKGSHVLVNRGDGKFVVQLPITGESGSNVEKGASARHNLDIAELESVTAAGNFDTGLPPENLPELAEKALKTFPAPNLSSPTSALSFIWSQYPNLLGASATTAGQSEMLRDGANILGIEEGALDLFARSQRQYVEGHWRVTLTYDNQLGGWKGRVGTPHVPAFFAITGGVFQVQYFQGRRSTNTVYARSKDPAIDSVGISYSSKEELGILVDDDNPSDFESQVISAISKSFTDGSELEVSGEYNGHIFQSFTERSINLRFGEPTTEDGFDAVRAHVRDELNGDIGTVVFVADSRTDPTIASIKKESAYDLLFKGLDLVFRPKSGQFKSSQVIGFRYQFSIKGKTASFDIRYLYDPVIGQITSTVENPDNRPPGVSILTRSFLAGYVSSFNVHYRARYAQRIDEAAARQEIYDYINAVAWPNVYEESRIGEIMTRHGASGVQLIRPRCLFYPSLADIYVDSDGQERTIPRWETSSLTPPINDFGLGERNVGYILPIENIKLNGFTA